MLSCLPLIETMCQKCRRTIAEYCKMSTSGWRALLKNVFVHRNEKRTWTGIDFLKVLYFFLIGYGILKDFSYLFGAKFTGRKFSRWRHDNWPLGQSVTSHTAPYTAYVNHFFPAWIYNTIHIHSGKTSRPQDVVARSFSSRPYALKLTSLTFKNL